MAVENSISTNTPRPVPVQQPSHHGAHPPITPSAAVSPPTKRELASWWKKFRKNAEKEDEKAPGIFGVALADSIRYANVAISLTNENGESYIYGFVPIVVAKCGVFLKEKATDVEGIFRLSGSAKRIKDLQAIFNSPERYGKGLDWTGYTVHDAANILRRYLNQLPEPIVPLEFYEHFREPLRCHQAQAVGDMDAQATDIGNFDHGAAVASYQKLITELPTLNRQLLLYILDLLAVFSSKSDLNRMTSANLAAIFQPGIISHPTHDMAPQEYRLSQDVLIFLIENQDNFLVGMTGTGIDEKTVKHVESGAPPVQSPKSNNLGRSASNASAGADSLRKYSARRNVSVSSRNSRGSNGVPSPVTPSSGVAFASNSTGSSSIGRSNTVPSKKSPAVPTNRFQRAFEPSTPTSPPPSSPLTGTSMIASRKASPAPQLPSLPQSPVDPQPSQPQASAAEANAPDTEVIPAADKEIPTDTLNVPNLQTNISPTTTAPPLDTNTAGRDRKISNLFSKSPLLPPTNPVDQLHRDQRQTNRLRKKQRIPGSVNESAQSSQNSLHGEATPAFQTPLVSPDPASGRTDPMASLYPALINTSATPTTETHSGPRNPAPGFPNDTGGQSGALKPPRSPEASIHSRSSVTDQSDFDALDDSTGRGERAEKQRHRWRFSSSARKNGDSPLAPPPVLGQNPGARLSNSSIGSSNRPRKSFTGDSQLSQQLGNDTSSTGFPSVMAQSSQESSEAVKDSTSSEPEKKGIFGKLKAKIVQSKDEKKEREIEKERAKSPHRSEGDPRGGSRQSLSVFTQDHVLPLRGRSIDRPREEVLGDVGIPSQNVPTGTGQQSPQPH